MLSLTFHFDNSDRRLAIQPCSLGVRGSSHAAVASHPGPNGVAFYTSASYRVGKPSNHFDVAGQADARMAALD